jgi:hypothetical protein
MIEQILFYIAVLLTIDVSITVYYTMKDFYNDDRREE